MSEPLRGNTPMTAEDRDDDEVHKIDTVPPPDGNEDAYSAETKVGPVTQDAWAALIRERNEEGERYAASSPPSRPFSRPSGGPASSGPRSSGPRSSSGSPSSGVSPSAQIAGALPRMTYEDEDEDEEKDTPAAASDSAAKATPRERPSVPRPVAKAALGRADAARPMPPPADAPAAIPQNSPPSAAPAPAPDDAWASARTSLPRSAVANTPSVAQPSVAQPSARMSARPLAFVPGDPALPPPPAVAPPPISRSLVVVIVACLLVFVAGVVLFVMKK